MKSSLKRGIVVIFLISSFLVLSLMASPHPDENESPKKIILGKSNEVQSAKVTDKTEARVEIKQNEAKVQLRERFENKTENGRVEIKTKIERRMSIEDNLNRTRGLKTEEIRTHQKEQLLIAVEKCKEKNLSSELCEKKLEKRTELVEKLKEKDLERLNRIEEKKLERRIEFEELKNNSKLRKFAVAQKFELREVKEEVKERAIGKIREIKSSDDGVNEKIEKVEKRLHESREKTRKCANETTEECTKIKNESFENSKAYLLNAVERAANALERLKERVNSSGFLSEEEANRILDELNAEETKIISIKSRIEQATTREELRNASRAFKEEWRNVMELHQNTKLQLALGHFGGIIVKSKHLETKLENVLKKLAIENKSTEEIEPLIAEFNEKINETRKHFELAQEKFKEAASSQTGKSELMKEANFHIKEARGALKEADEKLKEIIKKIREEDKSVLEEPEVEEENEE